MVAYRTRVIIGFLILLSPLTAVPVAQVIGLGSVTTLATTNASTLAYTNTVMHTYFGSGNGTTVAQLPVSFPERVIGFMAPKGKCSIYSLPVTVELGTTLSVRMTANKPVNFFILPEYPSGALDGCNVPSAPLLSQFNFTDFTLHWTAPANGVFYFVFTGPTAVILLTDHGSAKPVEQTVQVTYPTSVETVFSTYSTTTMISSTITATSPLYLHQETENGLVIYGSIVVAVAIACGLLVVARRLH